MATKGLLAKKIGMTQVFTEKGELLPVTVLEAGPCTVVGLRAVQKDGYGAVQLGFGEVKEKKLTKAAAGHFKKAGVNAHRHLKEVRLKADAAYTVGQALKADLFAAGELVDVTGTSKGKGFSGQHKRHHFGRGPVTHGSHNIKQPGSIGSSSTPSRVYKGMRMAGQLGNAQRTTMHLKIVRVDLDRNLLLINGDVPGHKNSVVLVRDSARQPKGKK
ncbi:MAG: 50S ribosomal protein L3 [Chloroflexi bacterium]|nr:MAG: 50S ribosomal protein L3 [Chloroflexota bacterium]TMD81060.1 MAG: 50S ribosomal protein L3 [Chloroflexota bacterium]